MDKWGKKLIFAFVVCFYFCSRRTEKVLKHFFLMFHSYEKAKKKKIPLNDMLKINYKSKNVFMNFYKLLLYVTEPP